MNVFDFINRNGVEEVQNPKYDKTTKAGRRQPKTVLVPDTTPDNNPIVDMAKEDYQNQFKVDKKTSDKYAKFGLNYTPWEYNSKDPAMNLDNQLADRQAFSNKVWDATKQAIWSELLLGTGKGIADLIGGLANIPSWIVDSDGKNNNDYSNPVSDYIEQKQQEYQENNPIYTRNDEGMFSASNIVAHIPSVAGMAAMFIPSTAFVKGISYLGKAAGLGKLTTATRLKLTRAYKIGEDGLKTLKDIDQMGAIGKRINTVEGVNYWNNVAMTGLSGIANTAMWNYAEAHSVYNQMYAQASDAFKNMSDEDYQDVIDRSKSLLYDAKGNPTVDINDRDAVARKIASDSADRTFGFDWYNALFTIPQYYGLRNIAEKTKNGILTSVVKKQQREELAKARAIANGGKAEDALKNLSNWDRVKNFVSDGTTGLGSFLGSQALGGAQMALVGFGRNEGLYYGGHLIDKDKPASTFDTRLNQYLSDPVTFEDTLWGIISGAVFHVVNGKIKSIGTNLYAKYKGEDAAKEQNDEGSKNAIKDLFKSETIDNKRRKTVISQRLADADTLIQKISLIEKGKNPFDKNSETREYEDFDSNDGALKDALYRQVRDNYIIDRTLKAANNGTLGLEKEYFGNEDVRKAMVKLGVIDEGNAVSWQQHVLDLMDKTEKEYDNQLAHINNEIQAINITKRKNKNKLADKGNHATDEIPLQYAPQIAMENTKLKLGIQQNEEYIKSIQDRINQKLETAGDKIPKVDYQSFYDAFVTANQLSSLYAAKKDLEKRNTKDIGVAVSLGNVNTQIEVLENRIRKEATDSAVSEDVESVTPESVARTYFIFNTGRSGRYKEGTNQVELDEDQFSKTNDTFDFEKADGKITANLPQIQKILGLKGVTSLNSDAVREAAHRYIKQFEALQKEKGKYNLEEIDSSLAKDMSNVAVLKNSNSIYARQIAYTRKELNEKALALDNTYNKAKADTIQDALDTVYNIHVKHLEDNQPNIDMFDIIDRFENKKSIDDIKELSNSEKFLLKDAFSILDLTGVGNHEIANGLRDQLNTATFINALKEKQDNEDGKPKTSTINKNQSETTENQSSNNNKENELKNPSEPQTSQKSNSSSSKQSETQQEGQPIIDNDNPENNNDDNSDDASGQENGDNNEVHYGRNTVISTAKTAASGDTVYSVGNSEGRAKVIRKTGGHEVRLVDTDKDGIYELVGVDGKPLDAGVISDTNLYDIHQNPADVDNPGVPISNPKVKLENGVLKVVETGTVDKLPEGQIRSDVDSNLQGKNNDNIINDDETNLEDNKEKEGENNKEKEGENNPNPNTSSTGGEDTISKDNKNGKDDKNNKNGKDDKDDFRTGDFTDDERLLDTDGNPIFPDDDTEIWGMIAEEVDELVRKGNIVDLDGIRRKYVNLYVKGSSHAKENADSIDNVISVLKDTYSNQEVEDTGKKKAIDLILSKSAIEDYSEKTIDDNGKEHIHRGQRISKEYKKNADAFIDSYFKSIQGNTIKGKKYISLEGLLNYANEKIENIYAARLIYDDLVRYLSSDEGKELYTTEDIADAANYKVLDRAINSSTTRLSKILKYRDTYRINTHDILNWLGESNKDYKATEKTINNLNIGDELSIDTSNGDLRFKKDGHIVGKVPIPSVDERTGAWVMFNKGVKTDVKLDSNGEVISKLYDVYKDLIENNDNNEDIKKLNDILTEYRYADKDRKAELYQEFLDNKYIKKLESKDMFSLDDKTHRAKQESLQHISNIWNYVRFSSATTAERIKQDRLDSVKDWFLKLNDSYTALQALYQNPDNYGIEISKVTDGEVILNNSKPFDGTDKMYNSYTPVAKALGKLTRDRTVLGVSTGRDGYINMAGTGGRVLTGIAKGGGNYIMIPNRNGQYDRVHAYGQKITDKSLGKVGKEIVTALHKSVEDCINDVINSKGESRVEAFNKLENTLRSLFQQKRGQRTFIGSGSNLLKGLVIDDVYTTGVKGNPNAIAGKKIGFSISINPKALLRHPRTDVERNALRSLKIQFKLNDTSGLSKVNSNHAQITISKLGEDGKTIVYKNYEFYRKSNTNKLKYVDDAHLKDAIKDIVKIIDDNSTFNISDLGIRSDSSSHVRFVGAMSRDSKTNEFIVKIGDKEWRAKNYNDFILKNNLIRVNTHTRDNKGVTNFNPVGERSQNANATTEIKISEKPPVESNEKTHDSESIGDKAQKIISDRGTDDNVNTGLELAKLVLNEKTLNGLSLTKYGVSIFPKNIIFASTLNNGKDHKLINAETNTTGKDITDGDIVVKNGVTVVGPRFIALLNNPKTAPRAARILMHEQLHQLLSKEENRKYVDSIRDIFNEFVEANKDLDVKDAIRDYEYNTDKYRNEDGSINDKGLEEFLIESLTSQRLADRLNEIKSKKTTDKEGNETLLSKIMEIISKVFDNFGIAKGSLREEEFKTLREAFTEADKKAEDFDKSNLEKKEIIENNSKKDNDDSKTNSENIDDTNTNTSENNANNENGENNVEPENLSEEDIIQKAMNDVLSNDGIGSKFEIDDTDDFDASLDDFSRIPDTDEIKINNKYATGEGTLDANKQSLSFNQKAVFDRMVERGALSVTCR